MDVPEIETDRLRLRAWRDSDLDDFVAMTSDREVMEFFGDPPSREDAWRKLALFAGHWQLRGFGLWAVELRDTGAFAGRVGLWEPEGWPGLEVGWVVPRHLWGAGYATEAARASLAFAFDRLRAARVIALIQPANVRSAAVARRLGMHDSGEATVRGFTSRVWAIDRAS